MLGDHGYKEPQGDEAQALYDYCANAFQAMVLIKTLSDAYSEYRVRLKKAQVEGINLCPKRDWTKPRTARSVISRPRSPPARMPAIRSPWRSPRHTPLQQGWMS